MAKNQEVAEVALARRAAKQVVYHGFVLDCPGCKKMVELFAPKYEKDFLGSLWMGQERKLQCCNPECGVTFTVRRATPEEEAELAKGDVRLERPGMVAKAAESLRLVRSPAQGDEP